MSWVMSASLIWSQNEWETFAIENRSVDISHNQSISSHNIRILRDQLETPINNVVPTDTLLLYIVVSKCGWTFCVYWNICEHSNLQLCRHSAVDHHLHPACNFQSVMTSVCGLAVEINFKVYLSKLKTVLKILAWFFVIHKNIIDCNWSVWSG